MAIKHIFSWLWSMTIISYFTAKIYAESIDNDPRKDDNLFPVNNNGNKTFWFLYQ